MGYTTFPETLYLELLYGFYNKRALKSTQRQKHTAPFPVSNAEKKGFCVPSCTWADP